MRQVYLDYSATTPVKDEVLSAMLPYFTKQFGNPSSLYTIGLESKEAVENARGSVAALIGAFPQEIYSGVHEFLSGQSGVKQAPLDNIQVCGDFADICRVHDRGFRGSGLYGCRVHVFCRLGAESGEGQLEYAVSGCQGQGGFHCRCQE